MGIRLWVFRTNNVNQCLYNFIVTYLNFLLEEGVLSAQTCLESVEFSASSYLFIVIDAEFFAYLYEVRLRSLKQGKQSYA